MAVRVSAAISRKLLVRNATARPDCAGSGRCAAPGPWRALFPSGIQRHLASGVRISKGFQQSCRLLDLPSLPDRPERHSCNRTRDGRRQAGGRLTAGRARAVVRSDLCPLQTSILPAYSGSTVWHRRVSCLQERRPSPAGGQSSRRNPASSGNSATEPAWQELEVRRQKRQTRLDHYRQRPAAPAFSKRKALRAMPSEPWRTSFRQRNRLSYSSTLSEPAKDASRRSRSAQQRSRRPPGSTAAAPYVYGQGQATHRRQDCPNRSRSIEFGSAKQKEARRRRCPQLCAISRSWRC